MYEIGLDITEDLLYSYLSEKQIMEHYLGIPVTFNKLVKSPLRVDKKPTCSFYVDQAGRLIFKDFGNCFHGNCIEVVKRRFSCDYRLALEVIYKELIEGKEVSIIPEENRVKYEPHKKLFEVKRRKLSEQDLDYWLQFGISKEILDLYGVTGLQTLWIDKKIVYAHSNFDPGFLYDFGHDTYKAYFPNRRDYRFLSNTSSYVIQGYSQLPKKGKLLVITKSLKDVMTLKELGYDAVAPQAESVLISVNQILELKARFKKIVSLMDFDYTGIVMMNKMKRKYLIPPYTLTNGRFYTPDFGAKDISDLVKKIGKDKVKGIIEER